MKRIFIVLLIAAAFLSGCAKHDDKANFAAGISYELNDVESNEGEISPNIAIILISSNITPESEYDSMNQKLIYRVEKRDTVEETECYIILFGTEENGAFKEVKRYAVDVYGKYIFEHMSDDSWNSVYTEQEN